MKKKYNSREIYSKKKFFEKDQLDIKFSKSYMIIGELLISIPLVIWLVGVIRYPHNYKIWIGFIIIFISGIMIFFIVKSFHIEITNGILRYSSPFSKIKEIHLTDIEEAFIEAGVIDKNRDLFRGLIRLIIRPKSTSRVKGFYINLFVFDQKDIKELLDILPMKD